MSTTDQYSYPLLPSKREPYISHMIFSKDHQPNTHTCVKIQTHILKKSGIKVLLKHQKKMIQYLKTSEVITDTGYEKKLKMSHKNLMRLY